MKWTFAKQCVREQTVYRAFMGEPQAIQDLYTLAKITQKNKRSKNGHEARRQAGLPRKGRKPLRGKLMIAN